MFFDPFAIALNWHWRKFHTACCSAIAPGARVLQSNHRAQRLHDIYSLGSTSYVGLCPTEIHAGLANSAYMTRHNSCQTRKAEEFSKTGLVSGRPKILIGPVQPCRFLQSIRTWRFRVTNSRVQWCLIDNESCSRNSPSFTSKVVRPFVSGLRVLVLHPAQSIVICLHVPYTLLSTTTNHIGWKGRDDFSAALELLGTTMSCRL